MNLILGGAYQGKLDYAKRKYHLRDDDIFTCQRAQVDFSARCLYHLEQYALECVRLGLDPTEEWRIHRDEWQNAVLIGETICDGVVPMDPTLRLWRQETGRLMQYLAGEADTVVRIFCGLEQRLK